MGKPSRKRDNFLDMARPAIIVAGTRSGGTFLCHCLSNHPRIFCDRGEPLHGRNVWYRMSQNPVLILDCLTHQHFYHVSMCKLTYAQTFKPAVWKYIESQKPYVIHLVRRNLLRQVVSLYINNTRRDRPVHSFRDVPAVQIGLDPQGILAYMHKVARQVVAMRRRLAGLPHVLEVEYASMAGESAQGMTFLQEETCQALCDFLGVPVMPLGAELRRMNPQPLSKIVANWRDLEAAVRKSKFAYCLEDDQRG